MTRCGKFFAILGLLSLTTSLTMAKSLGCSTYSPDGDLAMVNVNSKQIVFATSRGGSTFFSLNMPLSLVIDVCTVVFSKDSELAAIALYDSTQPQKTSHLLVVDIKSQQWLTSVTVPLEVQIPPPVVVGGFFRNSHQLLVSAANPFVRDGNATIFPELVEVSPDREHLLVKSDIRSVPAPAPPIIYLDPAHNRLWFGSRSPCDLKSETLFGEIETGPTVNFSPNTWCSRGSQVVLPDNDTIVFAGQNGLDVTIAKISISGHESSELSLRPPHKSEFLLLPGTIAAPNGSAVGVVVAQVRHGALGSKSSTGDFLAIVQLNPLRQISAVRVPNDESVASASISPDLKWVTFYTGKNWETVEIRASDSN